MVNIVSMDLASDAFFANFVVSGCDMLVNDGYGNPRVSQVPIFPVQYGRCEMKFEKGIEAKANSQAVRMGVRQYRGVLLDAMVIGKAL